MLRSPENEPQASMGGLLGLDRRRLIMAGFDAALVALAVFISFFVRFDGELEEQEWLRMARTMLLIIPLRLCFLYIMRCYRWSFRQASVPEFVQVAKAVGAGSIAFALIHLFTPTYHGYICPRWVVVMEGFISFVFLSGVRFGPPVYFDLSSKAAKQGGQRTLIVGAGSVGRMVAQQLWREDQTDLFPVGFVDDDPHKQGVSI
jgi:FlaA1/EpsC-like NDP-sugar epimerase